MLKKLSILVAGLAMAALPTAAFAGITGTVHDLPAFYTYTGTDAKMGTCSFCHLPHKAAAGGDKLFPTAYTAGLPAEWSSDSLSNICWFCHGAASGYLSAREVNPFQGTSHLRNSALLTAGIQASGEQDIAAVPTDLNLVATGTPANGLRCVSCHKIHDNTVKPFLAWGVSGNMSADATGFCGKCHPNRNNVNTVGTANPGLHPSNTTFADALGGGSPLTGAALPTTMQVDMTALTNPIAGAWNLGGHAKYDATPAETNTLQCASCHAVHANETATWDAADGGTQVTTPVSTPGNDLVIYKAIADQPAETTEAICAACHSVVNGIGVRGPGTAGTFSHPTGTQSATADTMFGAGVGYLWNTGGANTMVICQSCHDMHFSAQNHGGTATGSYMQAYQCSECHSVAGTALANHHPANVAVTAGTQVVAAPTTELTDTNWAARTQPNDGIAYTFPGGLMTCDTCHFSGLAKAHNNTGGFPGLIGRNDESDMCVDCHSWNPSTYTGHGTTGTATHYVGGINTDGSAYKFTGEFIAGQTSQVAKYSPDNGTGGVGAIICESCHSLKINGRNGHVITSQTSNNAGDGIASTNDNVRLLLLVSGNSDGYAAATENLCTACHGGAPGTGVTHPVLPAYTANSTMVPTSPATTVSGAAVGQINCESCHRPHDAADASLSADWSDAWILEAATNPGTYIDYSPVCGLCHTSQY